MRTIRLAVVALVIAGWLAQPASAADKAVDVKAVLKKKVERYKDGSVKGLLFQEVLAGIEKETGMKIAIDKKEFAATGDPDLENVLEFRLKDVAKGLTVGDLLTEVASQARAVYTVTKDGVAITPKKKT